MAIRVRQRILDFLKTQHRASASQIARRLGMRAPAVRHHLAILLADGRVERTKGIAGTGRGRPDFLYRVSQRAEGDNLDILASAALRALTEGNSQPRKEAAVSALARALLSRMGDAGAASSSRRMEALVARLNELHYAAQWEAGAEGPRVSFGRCPYAAIIKQHPELCLMDARAISDYSGRKATQLAKIDVDRWIPARCVFSLR